MGRVEVVPFREEDLEDAARLLAARHTRHRRAEPLLSTRYEEPTAALREVEGNWHAADASGAVARRDGRAVGYLLGAPRRRKIWGDNVFVESAGHAVEEAEDARDLYGLAAGRWVEEGRTRHTVLVPAQDGTLLDAWWRLGFGQQHAHGAREVPAGTDVELPAGFEIRPPREDEIEALVDVDLALPDHQRASPVFGGHMVTRDDSRQEWRETFDKGEETILICAVEGQPVACWAFVPVERSGEHGALLCPEDACFLGFAATLPEYRRSGIGVALTQAGLAWAAEEGYAAMLTDWRVTNLLASRFWPRRGFRTTFLRLYRSIP
jgi:ribosomal protein S18 acetylase RimI-like enzyme